MRSDFDLIQLAITGQHDLVRSLVADAQANRVNALRVFTRCENLFKLDGSMAGFWDAVEFVRATLNDSGIYFVPVFIVDRYKEVNGSMVELMGDSATDQWVGQWRDWCRGKDGVLPSIVNEPEQKWQGYSGPTDSRLIRYAQDCASAWGHKDFILGAAADGDDLDASAETMAMSKEVAKYVNLITIHDSRKGGASPDGSTRIRRWVDHIEAFIDIVKECLKINPDTHGAHEEPMGNASVQFVDIGGGRRYEREYDPQMALAGALTAFATGTSYCYHRIRTQDAGQPGLDLISMVLADWPAGWTYLNDSWGGSPTHGWDWRGGKCRSYVAPPNARTFVYGFPEAKTGKINWQNGYQPEMPPMYDGSEITVYKVHQ